jgi:hypothetical protein
MRIFLVLLFSVTVSVFPQTLVVNEVMSSNYSSTSDEDGEYSDWLEIFNNSDVPLDLTGYGVSDDQADLFKWVIPSYTLPAKDHLLIFASDKNRTDLVSSWETVIKWGDYWKYRPGNSEPPSEWKNLGFDDNLWQSGKSGFGYGDNDDSTVLSSLTSLYVRKNFSVDDTSNIAVAVLHMDYDDAFVAYLNGVEIARANIGIPGIPPAYNESSDDFTEPLIVFGQKPEAFNLKNFLSLLRPGNNTLAVQVHNYGTNSSDLTLIPFLTFGYKTVPSSSTGTDPILDLPEVNLHTNFKLNKDGETLFISDPQGNIADSVTIGSIPTDVSYGRKPDGSSAWFYFSKPTPGDSNLSSPFTGMAGEPLFSLPGGIYQGGINVILSPSYPGNTIRYTTDGSEPDENSPLYATAFSLTTPKVIRAREYGQDLLPGKIITRSYLINISSQLPVFSLSTKPGNFFDNDYGIYVLGDSAESNEPYYNANYWMEWERPVHIEFFDDNDSGFHLDAGVKIFGAWSRTYPQKSLAIYARSQYGYNKISYKLFRDLPFTEYEAFLLRNSGNDWYYAFMRDALVSGLTEGTGLDKQAYRPAVVFLNGQYWGIHDIREKINEHFIAAHHGINKDSINILEDLGAIVYGDNSEYMALYNFISLNSLAVQSNYEHVEERIDIDNFISYLVTQIYCGNRDWPGNNIKYWKKSGEGKWRWILYDTDYSFGIYVNQGYTHNTLEMATAVNGPDWPNPSWSTLVFRKLLENTTFRNKFINRTADFLNTRFTAQNVKARIFQLKSVIEPEIPRHSSKWNYAITLSSWSDNVRLLNEFADRRPGYVNFHIRQKFSIPGMQIVSLSINDTSKGFVKLNSLNITTPAWSGSYFMNIPLQVTAVAKRGYRFVKWEGSMDSSNASLVIPLTDALNLTAVFEADENFSVPDVVINEINYNSSLTFNPDDWIEFYNNSDTAVDLSGWRFMDEENTHSYIFPGGTILNARSYQVICRDTLLFRPCFPEVNNVLGNIGFGLSGGGELLRLFDKDMYIIDSLTYNDRSPWPEEADGDGPTLALINPGLDNSDPANWKASSDYGTPGRQNDVYTGTDEFIVNSPVEFSLSRNFPNPFNPETVIRFSIAEEGYTNLSVYNLIGEKVVNLVDEKLNRGSYTVTFNARNFPSGIYLYKLSSGSNTLTGKMILLK